MTRIGVLSDSHGDWRNLGRLLERMGKLDALCFLGDVDADADWLETRFETTHAPLFFAVRGNNDLASRRPWDLVTEIGGRRFFLTHGHRYHVRGGTDQLTAAARAAGAGIALYGHTHEPYCSWDDGVFVLNPGVAGNPWGNRLARGAVIVLDGQRIRVEDAVACW